MDWNSMELRHLRYFLKTAELMSFTRAAEAMNVTQSTLSHQIRQLEQDVGPLFERAGRAIHLTSRGRIFRANAERILGEVKSSLAALNDLEAMVTGQINFGAYRAFDSSPLPSVLTAFRKNYPGVEMRVHTGDHIELAHKLIEGVLDLAVGFAPVVSEKIAAEQLFVEPLMLIVGKEHPFHGRSQVAIDKLQNLPMVAVNFENRQRQLIQRSLSARGIVPKVVIELNSNEAVLAMVRCGPYATICPSTDLPGLHSVRITGLPLKRATVMLWRRDSHRSTAANAIAPMIKAAYAARRD